MRKLIKTISGQECEVFAIRHHSRFRVGKAVPDIEVYEDSVEVPTIGASAIRCKNTFFSIVICPAPEMDAQMTEDVLRGLTSFDLALLLPRNDDVLVPFMIYGVYDAELTPDKWVFRIKDPETLKKLLEM